MRGLASWAGVCIVPVSCFYAFELGADAEGPGFCVGGVGVGGGVGVEDVDGLDVRGGVSREEVMEEGGEFFRGRDIARNVVGSFIGVEAG